MNETMTDITMKDIIDIEDIVMVDWSKTIWLAVIAGLFVLALLTWLYRKYFRARIRKIREIKLSPQEKAVQELHRLDQQKFLERGDYRKYYFFLCDIFRQYLLDRFAYPAIDKTSEEIVPDLELVLPVDPGLKKQLVELLRHADDVKFARKIPSPEQPEQDRKYLLQLVSATPELKNE